MESITVILLLSLFGVVSGLSGGAILKYKYLFEKVGE